MLQDNDVIFKLMRTALDPNAQDGESATAWEIARKKIRSRNMTVDDIRSGGEGAMIVVEEGDPLEWGVRMPFGKYQGKTLKQIYLDDIGYLMWLLDKCEKMRPELRRAVEVVINRFSGGIEMSKLQTTNNNEMIFQPNRRQIPFNGVVMLLDNSGSMAELLPGGKTKHGRLKEALPDFYQVGTRLIVFSSAAKDISGPSRVPEPTGGTNLAVALKLAIRPTPTEAVIMTDGLANDPDQCFEIAKTCGFKINAVFIGDENDKAAIAFLNKLCALSGGTAVVRDLKKILPGQSKQVLSSTVKGLLSYRP